MSFIERLRSIEVTPRTTAICIVVVILVGGAVVVTAKNMANDTPDRPRHSVKATVRAKKVGLEIKERKAGKADADKTDKSQQKEKQKRAKSTTVAKTDPYAIIFERNLFKPIGPGASPSGKTGGGSAQVGPSKPMSGMPALPPMPKSGGDIGETRKNLAYTGMVELPGGPQALIENISGKETAWKKVGESAFGCRVVSISERSISMEKDGTPFNLSIGENKPDTDPGAKGGAPPSGSTPPQGGPGGPGGPPGSEGRPK
jgi:hypothetical protein